MRHPIETTIRYAVTLALASCTPATEAQPPPAPTGTASEVTVVVDAPNPQSSASADITSSELPPSELPPALGPAANAQEACRAYVESVGGTKYDPRTAHRSTGPTAPPPVSVSGTGGNTGYLICLIEWRKIATPTMVHFTPACCPLPGRRTPCPKPRKVEMNRQAVLFEQVTLDESSGAVSDRQVEEKVYEPEVLRHNCGRRPEGFAFAPLTEETVGNTLATMAALEAASVSAFHRLARELESLGAPQALVERARRAMHDEVRHTNSLRRLASDRGAGVLPWRRSTLGIRPQADVALENAVEGCVREAFGAATALLQSECAENAEIREAFRVIGEEECEHAALAWDVHAWFLQSATAEERARLAQAQQEAIATIEQVAATDPIAGPARRTLGLPDANATQALAATLRHQFGLAA